MGYAKEQQTLIGELNIRVSTCKKQYASWKKWCEKTGNNELWRVAGPAIAAKGNYYQSEIVKAKHNIARYMLGKDPHPTNYPGFWLEEIDRALARVPATLDGILLDRQEAERTKDKGLIGECWQLNYTLGCELFEIFLNNFKDFADWGKKRTYGGSV